MLQSKLLGTKLHRPALPAKWIKRPHLSERLNEGLQLGRRLTLVSAPAGFGKTTCVCGWIEGLEGRQAAWLSLDAADDDPGRFFAYFVAALQVVDGRLGRALGGVLSAGQLPTTDVISATLINDIWTLEAPLVLVLDDFHVIQNRFILQALETMLTNWPQPLHLVVVTREDPPLPLARLRANNQLTEIRARELRFSGQDIERFLKTVMDLSLSPADIGVLEMKTEGWIAGVQLAGLSAREEAEPARFIAGLRGSHRFVLSYLTEQVLDQQPQEVRQFLLQTSLLDRLNGELCDAVTGRTDSQSLLEQLLRANLFLISLDDEGGWYRYHHLFADLLRELRTTLQKEETVAHHLRACRWYATQENTRPEERVMFAAEAIRHALAGKDYTMAVQLLESHALSLIMQGYAKSVNGWLEMLPPGRQRRSPRTELAFAWMHLLRGAYAQAAPYLERAQTGFEGGGDSPVVEEGRALRAEWLVMKALLLLMEGKAEKSISLAQEALALTPETDGRLRSLAHWAVGSGRQLMGAYDEAASAYEMAMRQGRAAENAVAEMMAVSGLAQMALEQGRLHEAFAVSSEAVARVERSDVLPPISAVAYGALAQVSYEWSEVEEAQCYARRALELSRLGGFNSGRAFCRVLLSRLHQLEGELDRAEREIEKAVALVQGNVPDYIRQEVAAQGVRVSLAQDRLAAARAILQAHGFSFRDRFTFPDLPDEGHLTHALGLLYNSSLRVLLFVARLQKDGAGLAPGIQLAERLIGGARHGKHLLVELEALLLRAQMYAALSGSERNLLASRADYVSALKLGQSQGFIGVFLDQGPVVVEALADLLKQERLGNLEAEYVTRILAAFGRLQTPASAQGEVAGADAVSFAGPETLVEPLTARELEVLQLMAGGLSYKEIAKELFISLNTVRFHVKGIYGKLNANKRAQAVEAARQLHIL